MYNIFIGMGRGANTKYVKNTIISSLDRYRESTVSLFKDKSKKKLSEMVSTEDISTLFDSFISNIFFKSDYRWIGGFSDGLSGIIKKNTNLQEAYILFVNSCMQSLTTAVSSQSSKIDMGELEEFYNRIDNVNEKFFNHIKRNNTNLKEDMSKGIKRSWVELQQMFDAITDPIFVVDSDMNLLRINSFLKDKLRANDYKEILGKKADSLNYEGRPLCTKSEIEKVFSENHVHVSDVISEDEKNYYVQYIYPIKGTGRQKEKVTSALIYKKDITRHKAFEEEYEHLNRLATLGRLSAIVAHEIRNPLSGIGLSASLLKRKLEKDWRYFESLENILEGIDRIESVILRLLDFSKPKKTNKRKVNILDPLREALFFIKSRAEKQSVILEEDFPESLPLVFIDPDQITQVFINLLLNAIQSIDGAGRIVISIAVSEDFSIILKVSDTGSGIKKDDIPHIFEPFFTTRIEGTGLGLTISKNILMQNEIDISVDSIPGEGTTFILRIKAHHEI